MDQVFLDYIDTLSAIPSRDVGNFLRKIRDGGFGLTIVTSVSKSSIDRFLQKANVPLEEWPPYKSASQKYRSETWKAIIGNASSADFIVVDDEIGNLRAAQANGLRGILFSAVLAEGLEGRMTYTVDPDLAGETVYVGHLDLLIDLLVAMREGRRIEPTAENTVAPAVLEQTRRKLRQAWEARLAGGSNEIRTQLPSGGGVKGEEPSIN
jgi:hypothetical protein